MPKMRLFDPHNEGFAARTGCAALFISVLLISGMCSSLLGGAMFLSSPAIFFVAAVLATATAVPYGLFLLWLDRNEKEPASLLIAAFCWGAMAATLIGGTVSGATAAVVHALTASPILAGFYATSIAAPIFEELFKGLGVLALAVAFRKEFDNVLDGIVYGAIVGLGFAWFENITYYLNTGINGGYGDMLELALARGVYHGLAGHATFTALTGLGLGLARVQRRGIMRWFWPLLGLIAGTTAHFVWNTFAGILMIPAPSTTFALVIMLPFAVILLQLPFVILVATVLWFVWAHENEIIQHYLRDEHDDIATPEEIETLTPARSRTVRGIRTLLASGPKAWWRERRRQHDLIALSFQLWHHKADYPDIPSDKNVQVNRIRARLRQSRETIQA